MTFAMRETLWSLAAIERDPNLLPPGDQSIASADTSINVLLISADAAKGADVVITDINMPRMDGFGVIEGVRADPNHRTTPVLVLTTESDVEKKARARAAGATGWIVKPFDPAKLVDAVRRVAA